MAHKVRQVPNWQCRLRACPKRGDPFPTWDNPEKSSDKTALGPAGNNCFQHSGEPERGPREVALGPQTGSPQC